MSVMGTKFGTKTWSEARQNEITKSQGHQSNTSDELKKLGGDNIGDVANKIADSNWVDPSKKVRTVGSDKLDKEAFMKLMLAQMKNQDPTNPMKNHELAAQLAQFTSVEQMQNMNTTLTEIQKGQKPTESFQALNFIGKSVAGDSAKINRLKGDKEHEFTFNLPDDAKTIDVKVRNATGEIIRKVRLTDMRKGDNHWNWNGKTETGATAPVGDYTFIIEAQNAAGKKLPVQTDFSGLITGVSYTAEGPVLLVGSQSVKLKDVKKIVDPSLKNNDQISNVSIKQDLNKGPAASETEDKGAQEAAPSPADLLTTVGMSNGMMDKLKTETDTSAPQNSVTKQESKPEVQAEPSRPPAKTFGGKSQAPSAKT